MKAMIFAIIFLIGAFFLTVVAWFFPLPEVESKPIVQKQFKSLGIMLEYRKVYDHWSSILLLFGVALSNSSADTDEKRIMFLSSLLFCCSALKLIKPRIRWLKK